MSEENRSQYNPLQTSKQKSVWKVLDEWPPKRPSSSSSSAKKKKNPSRKEEQIERMRRFLVKNDAEFQKDARAQKTVRQKKDDENNSTRTKAKSVKTQLVNEISSDKNLVKDQEAERSRSGKRSSHSHTAMNSQKEKFEFSVLSYNILADNLMLAHPELYRKCETGALDWNYRWEGIKREILAFQCPDIICLQEVQFQDPDHANTHIIPFLSSIGYRSIVKPKTGNKDDGCLIAFSRERFLLEESIPVNYKVERVNVLDRDNVGLILKLVPLTNTRGTTTHHSPIIIATTHLLYNPKRTDIRLSQSALLLVIQSVYIYYDLIVPLLIRLNWTELLYRTGTPSCLSFSRGTSTPSPGRPSWDFSSTRDIIMPGLSWRGRAEWPRINWCQTPWVCPTLASGWSPSSRGELSKTSPRAPGPSVTTSTSARCSRQVAPSPPTRSTGLWWTTCSLHRRTKHSN